MLSSFKRSHICLGVAFQCLRCKWMLSVCFCRSSYCFTWDWRKYKSIKCTTWIIFSANISESIMNLTSGSLQSNLFALIKFINLYPNILKHVPTGDILAKFMNVNSPQTNWTPTFHFPISPISRVFGPLLASVTRDCDNSSQVSAFIINDAYLGRKSDNSWASVCAPSARFARLTKMWIINSFQWGNP